MITIERTSDERMLEIMALYHQATLFMKELGNEEQWVAGYPSRELILKELKEGNHYSCFYEKQLVAAFSFLEGEDPTYQDIREGAWLNDEPYGVVHRLVSSGLIKGGASFCLEWAYKQCGNLRVDTHYKNIPMLRLLQKSGFTRCGIITIEDGTERIAFQKSLLALGKS